MSSFEFLLTIEKKRYNLKEGFTRKKKFQENFFAPEIFFTTFFAPQTKTFAFICCCFSPIFFLIKRRQRKKSRKRKKHMKSRKYWAKTGIVRKVPNILK